MSDDCVACHGASTDGLGKAKGAEHLDFDLTGDVAFPALYDYEAGGGAHGGGRGDDLRDVRCHNGVTTPAWNGGRRSPAASATTTAGRTRSRR